MGISDYRNNDFRVSFGRVTPARCRAKNIARFLILTAWHSAFSQRAVCFRCGKIASSITTVLLQRDASSRYRCDPQKKKPGRSRAVQDVLLLGSLLA
jgi:hypothetical protein